jgi:transcriptional regulator with PAS, ATPase and Fis domain
MPPLRERLDGPLALVQALLTHINREMHNKVDRIVLEVMDAFYQYHWPGNIRELENVLLKAVVLCPGDIITKDLPPTAISGIAIPAMKETHPQDNKPSQEDVDKALVARVLEATGWRRGKTCEILGVSRPRLRRLIRHYT